MYELFFFFSKFLPDKTITKFESLEREQGLADERRNGLVSHVWKFHNPVSSVLVMLT